MNKIQYIYCDVDNTVCDSCQVISDDNAELINQIGKEKTFVFISGTDVNELIRMLSKLNNITYYILSNSGSSAYKVFNTNVEKIYESNMTNENVKLVTDTLEEIIKRFNLIPVTPDQILNRGSQITLSCIGRNAPKELKENFDKNKSKRQIIVNYLLSKLDGFSIKIGGTTSIDILEDNFDKSIGIKKFISEYVNFPLKSSIFFGDQLDIGGNDYCVKEIMNCVEVKSPMDFNIKLKRIMYE